MFRSNFLDHLSDLESIVWFHETGHTLGLCHRPEDRGNGGNVDRPPSTNIGCTKYRDTNHNGEVDPPGDENLGKNCTHYWVGPSSETAMGTRRGRVPRVWEFIDREINYEDAEWQNVDLKRVP